MPLVKNSEHRALITGYSADGAGVARIDGQVVFIPGAINGEQCIVKIIKVNKNIAYGRLVKVETPSAHRIDPDCPAYPKCGGCDFRHMDYEEELTAKRAHVQSVISRIGGIDIEVEPVVGASELTRYRNKAQFPVGVSNGVIVSGFYRTHSHDIVSCEDCIIQSEFANACRREVLAWMLKYKIKPYDEQSGKGTVRHIYVRNTMLCLIVNDRPAHLDELVARLIEKYPEISGILLNFNRERTNVILGDKIEVLYGEKTVLDTLCGNVFEIAPHAFYQVNHAQTEKLYELAVSSAALSGDETVIDLYCGAGTITLSLAKSAKRVIGVEIVESAVENARENARRNGISNVEFFCADASEAARQLSARGISADVVVVDPPRKGLTPALIDTISEFAPSRVVYVSCDPATLARDLKLFCEVGYETKKITPVDMFPRTRHVESVVLLTQTKPDDYVTIELNEEDLRKV